MTWFLGGISLLSLIISSINIKLEKFTRYFSFSLIFIFLAYVMVTFSSGEVAFLKVENFNLWTLLVLEGVLFWLFSDRPTNTIVPRNSLPIITSLFFLFIFDGLNKENVAILLTISMIFQNLLVGNFTDWDYLIRKALIALVISIFATLTYYIQGELSLSLVIFLYWYVSELIPLGIEDKNEDNIVQPIANRVLLLSLFFTRTKLSFDITYLIPMAGFIACCGSLSVYFSKSLKSVWKNFRRASEAMIIIIFLTYKEFVTENLILAILALSFYSFIPLLISAKSGSKLAKILRPLSIMALIGLFGGSLKDVLFVGALYSKLEGIGLLFLPMMAAYWLIVYSFWTRLNKDNQTESKIDQLTLLTAASAIIMSVIISF